MSATQVGSISPQSFKRDRDEGDDLETPLFVSEFQNLGSCSQSLHTQDKDFSKRESTPLPAPSTERDASPAPSSPARSSTGSLSHRSISTPPSFQNSPATAFAAPNGIAPPPKKRVKLTFAEKEERRILKTVRDQERTEERARKEAERKEKEEDKARKDAEREAERKRKESEKEEKRLMKEAEKAEKEKERKAKEEEKRRKEDEKQRIEEEKQKKAKQQPKLNAFFKMSASVKKNDKPQESSSPAPTCALLPSVNSSNVAFEKSEYEKQFPPFFVQNYVTMAQTTKFERDELASQILHDTLDSYIRGQRSPHKRRPFDAARLFNVLDVGRVRGRKVLRVREIMAEILGNKRQPIDLTTDSQMSKIQNARALLKKVPYKILSFAEDVRPPYKGTYTLESTLGVQKMARNPFSRGLPQVNYDYDSEAEWEEPEDGEDIESDGEEEEDPADGEEDLAEFLDDAEADTANIRRLAIQGDLEPISTGICWEDRKGRNPNVKMYKYRMEIINPQGKTIKGPIDPFCNYWDEQQKTAGLMEPPRKPLDNLKPTNVGVNGSNSGSIKMFGISDVSKPAGASSNATQASKKLVSAEDMPAFKQAINGSELTKLGLIEVLNKQFPKIAKSAIKSTLETVAKRVGHKEAEKRWVLIEEGPPAA